MGLVGGPRGWRGDPGAGGVPLTWMSRFSCSQRSSCRADTSLSRVSYSAVLFAKAWEGERWVG